MPEGRRPGGVTPCPRSGAAAENARLQQHRNGREKLPHVQGQGWWLGGATPCPRIGAAAGRTYSPPEARGCGWEEQPHLQGEVASRAQEGLEELFHVEGQKGQW